jgi:serine/threonine protein kinase
MDANSNFIIANKYKITECIGNGTFGCVYKGTHIKNNNTVAIKLEDKRTSYKLLKRETSIMKYLYEHQCRNIPSIYWFGSVNNYMGLVIPFYECSLLQYREMKSISESKLHSIMIKCISILESIHNNMVIHRDIKPQNFMVKDGELFLIDFGLATFYLNEDKHHIPNTIGEHITGTPKYVSHFIHDGYTPSRRDDLISLGYMYIYLHSQQLPWDSLPCTNDTQYPSELFILHPTNILRKNLKGIENLTNTCNEINQYILSFFTFCNNYEYYDTPNYASLYSLFS